MLATRHPAGSIPGPSWGGAGRCRAPRGSRGVAAHGRPFGKVARSRPHR
jgi:hypothetical protein